MFSIIKIYGPPLASLPVVLIHWQQLVAVKHTECTPWWFGFCLSETLAPSIYIFFIPSKNILKPDCPTFPYTFPILMATKKHINIHIAAPRCSSAIIRPRKYRHFQTSSPSTSTWLIHWQSCDTLKTTIDAFDLDSWNVCIPSHGPNIKYIDWLVVSSKSIANQTISNAWIQQRNHDMSLKFEVFSKSAFPKH